MDGHRVRSVAAAVRARGRALFHGTDRGRVPSRVAFVHIPKSAGTSVDSAVRAACGVTTKDGWINPSISREEARCTVGGGVPELAVPRWLDHRAYLLWHYLAEGHPVVSGHGPVSAALLDRFADETPFVTVLRDPVERWISYYRFSRLSSDGPNVVPNGRPLPCGRSEADELARVLESDSGRYIGAFDAIYLGGHRPYSDADPIDAVDAAVAALRRFRVIGFTSDWTDFVRECREQLGLRIELPHLNSTERYRRSTHEDLASLFTADVRARIGELCAADYEIHREARRIRGMDPEA